MTHTEWLEAHGFSRDGDQWVKSPLAVEQSCPDEWTAEHADFDRIGIGESPKIALLDLAQLLSDAACVALGATQRKRAQGQIVGVALEPAKKGQIVKVELF